MHEVEITSLDPNRFEEVVGAERTNGLAVVAAGEAIEQLTTRSVINVNSTAAGGGVAEMLHVLLGYVRGAGIDTRWLVIEGTPDFFALTKRVHNHLYGTAGDGGALGEAEHTLYESALSGDADALAAHVSPGDIVLLHDPQTAGLAAKAKELGALVIWRCHVGVDTQNDASEMGWDFLRRYLEPHVDHYVFSDARFPPVWVPDDQLSIIWPSVDPFAPKNQHLAPESVEAILTHVGIIAGHNGATAFTRTDGSSATVERMCDIIGTGPPPTADTPLIVQVSRWDHMKDMAGVMTAFAEHVDSDRDVGLVLAGPVVSEVADDPEGGQVLQECWETWRQLPHAVRSRVQLVCIPMHDLEENAVIVNALQRHATIVVQKSLAEGFGLTAAEAMLKGVPVVASAVGGLVDQVIDNETGRLLHDPTDLAEFGAILCEILDDDNLRQRLGEGALARAREVHLGDTHLQLWLDAIRSLLSRQ